MKTIAYSQIGIVTTEIALVGQEAPKKPQNYLVEVLPLKPLRILIATKPVKESGKAKYTKKTKYIIENFEKYLVICKNRT